MSTETAPQPPARRNWFARHKFLTVLGAIVVLIIVIAVASGGRGNGGNDPAAQPAATDGTTGGAADDATPADEPAASAAPAAPGIGVPVKSGDFEFTVLGVEEIGATVGDQYLNETAQGRYIAVSLRVANTGKSAATFFSDNVQIIDAAERTFDSDSTATLYAAPSADAWLSEINPGNSFEGRVVFDLPADATPAQVVVKDNAFAGGEKIRLQ